MRSFALRRSASALLVAMLAATLLALPVLGPTGPAAVFAAEAEDGEGPPGPEPLERHAEDNPARELAGYEDRETPFTWGAAWILTFAGVVGLVLMLGLYHLLVRRPTQRDQG